MNSDTEYKILISSCLLNQNVRYNGEVLHFDHPFIQTLKSRGCLMSFCPEVEAGMSVPRLPIELQDTPESIFVQKKGIIRSDGVDVTSAILAVLEKLSEIIRTYNIQYAILKEKSPTCGVHFVYDGSFSGRLRRGKGIVSWYLEQNNVQIFSENELHLLQEILEKKENE
jgi:uncharacterized protein YbbK (DUF523 family)